MIGQSTRHHTSIIPQPIRCCFAGWVCFLAGLFPLFGQPDNLYFHHLTLEQGLSQSTNSSIYRDSSGFVWIGSAEGLNRFDGIRVKVYKADLNDPHQLADPTIISPIFEDKRGDLWFCTLTALHCYRRQYDHFDRFLLKDEKYQAFKGCQAFHLDRHEQLWLHCNGQIYLFDVRTPVNAALHPFRPLSELSGSSFRLFEQDLATGSDTLYVLASPGVERYAYNYQLQKLVSLDTLFVGKHGQPKIAVQEVFQEKNGTLWLGCDSSLFQVKPGGALLRIHHFAGQSLGNVRQIQPWGDQYLFIATDQGLYLLDKITLQFIRHWQFDSRVPSSLSTNNLWILHLDRDQNLWVSAWTKGVDYTNLRKLKFQTHRYYKKDKNNERTLFMPGPILEDGRKQIWCGSQMHGLLALQTDATHQEDFSALAPKPDQLFALEDGKLLINNFRLGLSLLDPENKTSFPLLWQGDSVKRFHVCIINTGTFIVASGRNQLGLIKLTIKGSKYTFEPITMEGVAKTKWLYVIRRSDHEFLLADNNYTINYFRESPNDSLRQLFMLPGFINCALKNDTSIWLGGSFGLCQIRYSDYQPRYITSKDGLPTNMVYAIAQGGPDDYWLSTGKGLVRFHPSLMQFQSFTSADGLQALEYNHASCLHTSDGTLWFGGIGGYNYFRPEDIQPLKVLPKIQIVDIQINDLPYSYGDNPTERHSLRLPYDSSTLTFHFAALEFSDPANNHLKYQLDFADGTHFDRDWVYCQNARGFARYSKLPPGQYTLKIMGTNSDSIWNPVAKEFFIQITPPFYQTWRFKIFISLVIALVLYAIYRSRLSTMRKKEEQKRRMIELELNALRAQLNPHFISNNLISINSFIRNNGVEKVRGYVATFARLMRNVLESARNPVVPLAEELEMLQNFVTVESGRFPQPIDFSVHTEAGIDATQVFLPGMLLQPFVENAIVHGLGPRNGQGKITVEVSREQNALVFVIEDDGVGRNKLPTVPSAPERKSHGLDITRERLHLYDLQHNTTSLLQIEDLTAENGTHIGTRVVLRLGLSKP